MTVLINLSFRRYLNNSALTNNIETDYVFMLLNTPKLEAYRTACVYTHQPTGTNNHGILKLNTMTAAVISL